MLDSFEPGFLLECCGVRELQAPEKCNENIKRYKLSFRPLNDKFTKKLTLEFKRPKFTRLYLFSFVRVRISMNRFSLISRRQYSPDYCFGTELKDFQDFQN